MIRSQMNTSRIVIVALAWVASVVFVSAQKVHPSLIRNHPAIAYATAPVSDPIAQLNGRLQRGEVTLEKHGPSGYLSSVLSALEVPIDSQVLVFSKTSFQAPRINPTNPRAIFFNDTVSVGWVRGGPVLEFVAQDSRAGLHLLHAGAVAIRRTAVRAQRHLRDVPRLRRNPQRARDVRRQRVSQRRGHTMYGPGLYDGSSKSVRAAMGWMVRHRHSPRDPAHG